MISKTWRTSERKYGVSAERDVAIPMSDGINLDCDLFRPDGRGKFPAILGVHPFEKSWQSAPSMPQGFDLHNGSIEAGDSNFFVRRGYAHVIANVRGTGRSEGQFANRGPQEVRDTYEVIEWIARQPWCDGNVGMFGPSYFAITQLQVAALNPPHLKALFAPFGYTDFYRDNYYHGGIFFYRFVCGWANRIFRRTADHHPQAQWFSWTREKLGDSGFREAIKEALEDNEIKAVPDIIEALRNPDRGANPLIVDLVLNRFDGDFYQERAIQHEAIKIPTYLGGCWGIYGLHLPGAFRAWEKVSAPKKMVIGPPIYLDRPIYQYQYESLRWFDHWLKGMENGIMEEPPVRLFIMGTDEWKAAHDWPLPETRWTPFYLHANNLLSEHEYWPDEGCSSYEDNLFNKRGGLTFLTPPLVENTEVVGPASLTLFASTTDTDVLWFISLLDVDPAGQEKRLTRGWLRGSQRALDTSKSKPWEPFHPHTKRELLTPKEIYEFNIKINGIGNLFKAGHRIGLRIRSVDDESPKTSLEAAAQGHLWRTSPAWVTIYHNEQYPSSLLLPVTKGNIIGTYISGGDVTLKSK